MATGGGTVLAEENRKCLRERGWIIYLKADTEQLLDRLQYAQNRPLLRQNDRETVLKELINKRAPLYQEIADLVVDTNNKKLSFLSAHIINSLNELGYPIKA